MKAKREHPGLIEKDRIGTANGVFSAEESEKSITSEKANPSKHTVCNTT